MTTPRQYQFPEHMYVSIALLRTFVPRPSTISFKFDEETNDVVHTLSCERKWWNLWLAKRIFCTKSSKTCCLLQKTSNLFSKRNLWKHEKPKNSEGLNKQKLFGASWKDKKYSGKLVFVQLPAEICLALRLIGQVFDRATFQEKLVGVVRCPLNDLLQLLPNLGHETLQLWALSTCLESYMQRQLNAELSLCTFTCGIQSRIGALFSGWHDTFDMEGNRLQMIVTGAFHLVWRQRATDIKTETLFSLLSWQGTNLFLFVIPVSSAQASQQTNSSCRSDSLCHLQGILRWDRKPLRSYPLRRQHPNQCPLDKGFAWTYNVRVSSLFRHCQNMLDLGWDAHLEPFWKSSWCFMASST